MADPVWAEKKSELEMLRKDKNILNLSTSLRTSVQSETNPILRGIEWWKQHVDEPWASLVMAPAAPNLEPISGETAWQRKIREYRQWQAPRFVKGAVEFANPLYFLPVGGIVGKAGKISKASALAFRGIGADLPAARKIIEVTELLRGTLKETQVLRAPVLAERFAKSGETITEAKVAWEAIARGEKVIAPTGAEVSRMAIGAFNKGKLPRATFKIPKELLIDKSELSDIQKFIWQSADEKTARETVDALYKVFQHTRKSPVKLGVSELDSLKKFFGDEAVNMMKTGKWSKIVDAMNLPRAVLASWDFSAPLRQGVVLFAGHPIKGLKAMGPMFKSFFSESSAKAIEASIHTSKYYKLGQKAELYIANLGTATRLAKREESFMSSFAHAVPLVKRSERAYVNFLNKLRQDTFDGIAKSFTHAGHTEGEIATQMKLVARFINNATGRGSLPKTWESAVPLLNTVMFSPRLQASHLMIGEELVRALGTVGGNISRGRSLFANNPAAQEALRSIVSFVGANLSLLTLLQMSGAAKIELDPRSTDWGKIRIGNTRLDPWAGFQQYGRLIVRLATGQAKTGGGNVQDINRLYEIQKFGRTKLSPVMGLVTDLMAGQTLIGESLTPEEVNMRKQMYNRLAPLFLQDLSDAIGQEGFPTGLIALPGAFGMGVVSYGDQFLNLKGKTPQELRAIFNIRSR